MPVSQIMLTFTPGATSLTPKAIHRYPKANRKSPNAILVGAEGSLLPIFNHSQAKTGANMITKIELSDWNKLAGTTAQPRSLCVCLSAKKVREAPACSKADQKNI